MRSLRCWMTGVVLLGAGGLKPARADIVYSQDPNLLSVLFTSDSTSAFGLQQADDFTLGAGASIQAITFYGKWTSLGQPAENFTVRFFQDMGGTPNVNPNWEFTGLAPNARTSVGFLPPLLSVFQYEINLPSPVNLNAGTTYYISVVNNASNILGDWGWLGTNLGAADRFQRNADGVAFTTLNDANLTFALLTTPVPEPSPALLASAALIGVRGWRKFQLHQTRQQ